MKKTFTFFAISALFLMFLFPVSVKADTTLSFIFEAPNGDPDEDCNGNTINNWNAITTSDFHFSSALYNEVKQQSSYLGKSWTSFKAGAKACTRHDVHLEAGSYTFTLKTTWMYGNNNTRVPIIRVNNKNYSIGNVDYANGEEVDLEYTVSIPSTNDYPILITCVDGEADKFCMRTLTITPNCTQHTVTVAADDNDKGTVAGGGSYCENSEVTVTATPKPGYNFVNWTDNNNSNAVVSTDASYTFTLTANVNYRANFAACEGATVTVNVNDGVMGSATGGGSYCAGSQVNLTATPNSGYRFVNWTVTSGSASLDDARSETTHFVMSDPATAVTIQANFEEDIKADRTYTYRAVEDNTGHNTNAGESTDEYLFIGADGQYIDFTHYSAVATTCTIKVGFYAPWDGKEFKVYVNDGQEKANWTWNTTEGERDMGEFNLSAGYNKITVAASWNWYGIRYIKVIVEESKYVVTVVNNDTYGTVTAASSNFAGEVVNISVDANPGYFFSGWASDDVTFVDESATSTTFIMPANAVTITANYEASVSNTFTYTAIGSGNISCATASGTKVSSGTEIELTATPDPDYTFTGWSSSDIIIANASANPLVFTMPANAVSVTANFTACTKHTVTLTAGANGSVSGGGLQCDGSVTVTATPNSDYRFVNWTNTSTSAEVSTDAVYTFTLLEDISLTANFAQIDNVIITGDVASTEGFDGDGNGTMNITSVADFDAFNHNVLKFAYSDMNGKYKGKKIFKNTGYSSSASAQATGFGFYYKTEKEDDHVAFCFEVSSGQQVKWELQATGNVWKYFYFPHAGAASWNGGHIAIFMNGDDQGNYSTWNGQGTHTTYKNDGAFYMSEIAATSITSKPDIANYHYTNDRGGAMQVGDYGTLCLPMGGTISGATLYSVAGKETGGDISYLVLEDQGTNVVAGKPYITQSTATSYTVTMSGAHSAVQDGNGLVGTYETINLTPYAEPGTLNYFLYANAFKKAGTGVTVGAYRAYLNWDEVSAPAPAPSARRIRMVIEGQEVETGMETVTAMPKTTKVLIDGQLFIIREGKRYTLTGARAQ